MLDDPYKNKAYEALKKTMEDRSTWRKSNTKKESVRNCGRAGNCRRRTTTKTLHLLLSGVCFVIHKYARFICSSRC